jgi:hypothetical protein
VSIERPAGRLAAEKSVGLFVAVIVKLKGEPTGLAYRSPLVIWGMGPAELILNMRTRIAPWPLALFALIEVK